MNGIENVGIQNIGKIDDPSPLNKITYHPPLISLEKAMRNTSSGPNTSSDRSMGAAIDSTVKQSLVKTGENR